MCEYLVKEGEVVLKVNLIYLVNFYYLSLVEVVEVVEDQKNFFMLFYYYDYENEMAHGYEN
jgi:hypothetical protein